MQSRVLVSIPLLLVAAFACGSEVVAPAGTSAGSTSASSSSAGGAGGAGTSASSSSGAGGMGLCEGVVCGEPCVVCNDVECLEGTCDANQSCAPPFEEVMCGQGGGGGVGGGSFVCPPPAEVQTNEPCNGEGATCPSDHSCSGVLDCSGGVWVLFQLC